MTTTRPLASPNTATDPLDQAVAAVETQLARIDNKAGLLFGFTGALLLYTASNTRSGLPPSATITGYWALAALTAATSLLFLVVWPRTGGGDRASWPYWAKCSVGQIQGS